MRQRRGAIGGLHRTRDIAGQLVVLTLLHPTLNQIQRANDALKQIIEVMRDAASQLSNGLHLVRLAQRLLRHGQFIDCRFLIGDVATIHIK